MLQPNQHTKGITCALKGSLIRDYVQQSSTLMSPAAEALGSECLASKAATSPEKPRHRLQDTSPDQAVRPDARRFTR